MAEKLKKGEVKIEVVLREKMAGKLEDVMCLCRRAKTEETYVEYSDGGKDFFGGLLPVLDFQGFQRPLLEIVNSNAPLA